MRSAPVPILILVLFAGDVALGLAYLINELMGRPRDGLTHLLDLGGEANFPAWYSAMQGLLAALMLWTFARRRVTREDRTSWVLWLLPAVLLLMSCDEVAQLHERVGGHADALLPGGSRANTAFVYTGIWMFVVGIPFIAFLTWLLIRTRRHFAIAHGAIALFVGGFATLLTGSLVMDGVSNAFEFHSLRYNLVNLGEEVLEMIGMTIICWASFNLAIASMPQSDGSPATALTAGIISSTAKQIHGETSTGSTPAVNPKDEGPPIIHVTAENPKSASR